MHYSKIELAENIWLGYNLEVLNNSIHDSESQEIKLEISYPKRNISVCGLYQIESNSLDSSLAFQWFKNQIKNNDEDVSDEEILSETKSFETSFKWKNHEQNESERDHQTALITIKHPSFESDVNLQVRIINAVYDSKRLKLFNSFFLNLFNIFNKY